MRPASPRLRSLAVMLGLASPSMACGDDEGGETGGGTTSAITTSTSTSEDDSTTSASTLDASTTSTSSASTTADDTVDGTTGPVGDPVYPPIDAGSCPGGTAPIMLPGAQLCAPFCGDADDVCPPAASGDAPAQCTPFAGQAGSGDACDDLTPCSATELCGPDGTCSDVAFWACQLACAEGQACPEAMECSGIGTCGYP